jgi:anaerobic dimethyl sulfoxide reductase subunit A
MKTSKIRKIPVTCNLDCGGDCPLLAHVEQGKIVKISNNPLGGRYMSGCVKGFNMQKALYSPNRLTKPLIRDGPRGSGVFKEITWTYAIDLVAEKLLEIKNKYGNKSILFLGWSGAATGSLHNTWGLPRRFLSLFGGFINPTQGYSSAAARYATPFVLGTQAVGIDPETLQYSNLIILWGANIVDTRLETMLEPHIREAKERGVDIIVIDPRRTRTVKTLGTSWIPIYPGTDTALMAAILYVLIQEKKIDRNFISKYSYGFEELEKYILGDIDGIPKTPQWAENVCGTPSDQIISLAKKYGEKHPTALIPGLSIQRTIGGEEAIRMAIALQTVTGNIGVLGGSTGGLTWGRLPSPKMGAINIPENPDIINIPVYIWPDIVLEGKKGGYPSDIKAIYNAGGNLLNQGSDINKNIKAFKNVEFAVSHDQFLTPTAKYCDIVLPVTFSVERNDIINPDGGNYLLFSNKAVDPPPEARNDYDIFCDLADKLGFLEKYTEGKSEEEWLESFIKSSEILDADEFKRSGIYFGKDKYRVGLSEFIQDPIANPLNTPSGLIQISSPKYAETGFSAIPECRTMEYDEKYPLRLVTPKSMYRVHSQFYNIPWYNEREKQDLWINPKDAKIREIENDDIVIVSSSRGSLQIEARVTEDIMPGVVSILEGAWPNINSDGIDTAGSVNILTSSIPTLPSQGSRTHSVIVQITRKCARK